jgi:AraC-like DNA-binding protein
LDETAAGYRELAPPLASRAALACLWVRVVPSPAGARVRVLPDACVDLVWRAGHGAFVAGPDTGPTLVDVEPGGVLVGARFLPGSGGGALGLPLSELRDTRVDAAPLWPDLAQLLPPTLDPSTALARMRALGVHLTTTRPSDLAVRAAARRVASPDARVESLANELGLSERQLRRRCHAGVGYGPKTLQRVMRFQRVLAALDRAGGRLDLARLAFEAGYADQAHLSRETSRLAGLSPSRLARTRQAAIV